MKDSAFEFTKELGGFLTDVFFPGAGQFVKLFLDLARDPEAFRVFIEGFVDALPEVIISLSEAMPIVAEALAENVDKIVVAIVLGAIKLIEGAIRSLFRIAEVYNRNVARELQNIFGDSGQAFIDSINEGVNQFISAISEFFEKLDPTQSGGTTGRLLSGDVGGALGEIGGGIAGALGFADGGVVPPGFPNDTFPARLTSGEVVLNEDQQRALAAPQMITVNLTLNEETLASTILELNRDNLRTA